MIRKHVTIKTVAYSEIELYPTAQNRMNIWFSEIYLLMLAYGQQSTL